MAFLYYRTLTIDHTKVPSNQTNFPVVILGTLSYLATVANGGRVQSSSGYDIIFTSDQAGTTVLNFERVHWSPTTGYCEFWVQVPTVSSSVSTVIYMQYGDSTISTDQSNGPGTWDSNYVAVYHFGDGTTLSVNDSTSNANNGTSTGSPTAVNDGIGGSGVGGSIGLVAASSQYADLGNGSSLNLSTMTAEAYAKVAAGSSSFLSIISQLGTSGGSGSGYLFFIGVSGGDGGMDLFNAGTAKNASGRSVTTTNWQFYVSTYDGTNDLLFYTDAALDATTVAGSSAIGTNTNHSWIGCANPSVGLFFNGDIDELRISKTVRSADWITAQNNMFSFPTSFTTVGSEQDHNLITNQTILGQASIKITTDQTILGQASLVTFFDQTILGQSDIQVTTDQTIKGQSDIAGTTDQTILGQADIQKFTSQTIEGQSDIRITTNQTILGQSDIPFITDQTLLGQSLITIKTNQTQLGQSSIKITTDQTIKGQSDVTTPTDQTIQGQAFIQKLSGCYTFEGLPLGYSSASGWPAGMTNTSLGGNAVVTSSLLPSGFTRYARLGSTANLTYLLPLGLPISGGSVVGNFLFAPGNGWGGSFLTFQNYTTAGAQSLCILAMNQDGTMSFESDGPVGSIGISPPLVQNRWYWFQCSFNLIVIFNPITMVNEVWVANGYVFIDGIEAITDVTFDTGFSLPDLLANAGMGFNQIIFETSGNATGFTNFCFAGFSSTATYPSPGFPNVPPPTPNIRMRVANAFTEFSRQTTKGDMIVAQGFTELAAKPTTSNMKVAQGFIELALLVTPPTPQPPPPVPTNPPTGRGDVAEGRCGPPQIVPTIIPTIPDPPISGIPNPPPPSSPARYCYAQLPGPPFNTN